MSTKKEDYDRYTKIEIEESMRRIAVMEAYLAGRKIECERGGEWHPAGDKDGLVIFCWQLCDYRVAPGEGK